MIRGSRDPARTRQPVWLEPELATLTRDRFSDPAWIFEREFDGERLPRVQAAGQQLRLMTRSRLEVTGTYPQIADALRPRRPATSSSAGKSWPPTGIGPVFPAAASARGSRARAVAQAGFTEWTADGQLRHPRFRDLRRDKTPRRGPGTALRGPALRPWPAGHRGTAAASAPGQGLVPPRLRPVGHVIAPPPRS